MEIKSKIEREKYVDENKTENGGWTKEFLLTIGVSWPPKSGWRKRYIKTGRGDK